MGSARMLEFVSFFNSLSLQKIVTQKNSLDKIVRRRYMENHICSL